MTDEINLREFLVDKLVKHSKLYEHTCDADNAVVSVQYENNSTVYSNKNYGCYNNETGERYSYIDSQIICKELGISFKNQSISALAREYMLSMRHIRNVPKMMRDQVKQKANHICKKCKTDTTNGEVDHIIRIDSGGNNEPSNLQYLCKECHTEKTTREMQVNAYISQMNDHVFSTFFDYPKWAFVFNFDKPLGKKDVELGVDHEKCRKNIVR